MHLHLAVNNVPTPRQATVDGITLNKMLAKVRHNMIQAGHSTVLSNSEVRDIKQLWQARKRAAYISDFILMNRASKRH